MNEEIESQDGHLWNAEAASGMLNVSVETIKRWGDAGKIRSLRASSRGERYFSREDIEGMAWRLFQESCQ